MNVLRFIVGVLLLPAVVAATRAAVALVTAIQPGSLDLIPPSALALGGGYALWLVIFFALPRPVRTYVLAHELTHALWAWLFGAEVRNLRVSGRGGSVTVSRTNFLITLAPYFFPLYTVLAIAAYFALGVFVDMAPYYLVWLGLVGFTWGFHFTFTLMSLLQHQSDIRACGHLFSYVLIYLFNVLGLCAWIVMVATPSPRDLWLLLRRHGAEAYGAAGWHAAQWAALGIERLRSLREGVQ